MTDLLIGLVVKLAWRLLQMQSVAVDVRSTYAAAVALAGKKKVHLLYRLWEEQSDALTRAGDPVRVRPAAFRTFLRSNGVSI